MKTRLYRLLYSIQLWLALGTLAALAAPTINPNDFWPAAFFSLSIPFLLAIHFAFGLWWLFVRRYYVLVSAGCLLLGWSHVPRIVNWSSHPDANENTTTLGVMSYNVHGMRHASTGKSVDVDALVQLVSRSNCNLLCLQEFPRLPAQLNRLTALLRQHTPLKFRYSDTNGNFVIFSSFPIDHAETHYFPNRSNGFQHVTMKVGSSLVSVFNVHLQSNAVTQIAERVASQGDLQTKETWLDIRGMMGRFKRAARQRALQAETLAALIAQSKHPVILTGDLNDTPHSYTYRTLSRSLQDSFVARGRGLGITYAGKIPALRIDYVMTGHEFTLLEHHTEAKGFSDHKAIWANMSIPRE